MSSDHVHGSPASSGKTDSQEKPGSSSAGSDNQESPDSEVRRESRDERSPPTCDDEETATPDSDATAATISDAGSERSDEDKTGVSSSPRPRKRKRRSRGDAAEIRLQGRRAMCKSIAEIAPHMLKTVKLRVLGRYLESTRGLDDAALTEVLVNDAQKIARKERLLEALNKLDPDVDRRNLKSIIIYGVLLQEEAHSLDERRLDQKVLEFEKNIVTRARSLDFFDEKKHDSVRCHHYDTYRIVLEAAWRSDDDISADEAALLAVLRNRLNISLEEHWLIGAYLKRFPRSNCALHTPDDVNEARKELQRESILWSYRDESHTFDVIPHEVVTVIRSSVARQELQRVNFRRMLSHDFVLLADLRTILQNRGMDRYGNKDVLIERVASSDIQPSEVLSSLDRSKLSDMCRHVRLKSSGNKPELISRLIDFYDDLSFEERETKDAREEWYHDYELLASRRYSDLRAKKLISKDIEIEHKFEQATNFLFQEILNVRIDVSRKVTKADGRILLAGKDVILWDCKSSEGPVNLQDYLESQFDFYVRTEREKGFHPLAFIVIGPTFSSDSIRLAHRYKARTNCDVALITAAALKELSERWEAMNTDKPFPVRLFNRTEVIEEEQVTFLLSLA